MREIGRTAGATGDRKTEGQEGVGGQLGFEGPGGLPEGRDGRPEEVEAECMRPSRKGAEEGRWGRAPRQPLWVCLLRGHLALPISSTLHSQIPFLSR